MRYRNVAILTAILVVPIGEVAADGAGEDASLREQWRSKRVFDDWVEQMEELDRRVQAGEGKKALKTADRLAKEIIKLVKSGDAGQLLGGLSVLRALAAYNAGDQRLALWHWHIGVQISPEFSGYNLDRYGEAGSFLKGHPFQGPPLGEKFPEPKGELTPPKRKKAPRPKFPLGKLVALNEPVAVVVQVTIDKEGRVNHPVILKAEGELILVLASLESFWRWEFEPAKLDGEPVDAYYQLTINFTRRRGYPG